ncbi:MULTISPECIES: Rrf2 family transcriptional regulator [Asticcacaulis]|uniref:Rrf2 family transcriptional regulator n=1 Tax=Asticcacaulis TaxID=76890 RepID=UPI001AE8E426|nr:MULTISPECIES: Rrf2 family transcriptional regulator [Asticcacaulis]MBP2158822.1 DNA-binding IscR family transcriptional regulator [Asticcacaulis solisilvae]MDR6799868.1 DNA-binding IscR family transcriptional regulator [Asticcacaulis sp. BE141]
MASDNRLSRMLHVLIHMAERDTPMTSDDIARVLATNAVVVRRTMAGLRDKGYVTSEKGHGGGWRLVTALEHMTLYDVYAAIGSPAVFALGMADDHPRCLVEQAVNDRLEDALTEARALLFAKFSAVSLADIAADFQRRYAAVKPCN